MPGPQDQGQSCDPQGKARPSSHKFVSRLGADETFLAETVETETFSLETETLENLPETVAYLGFDKGGGHGERGSASLDGVWGIAPVGSRAKPWSGASGGKAPWSWRVFLLWLTILTLKMHFW